MFIIERSQQNFMKNPQNYPATSNTKNMEAQNFKNEEHPPKPNVVVVMVPLPAQGHLNQLLHLSHLITSYGIPVHYAGSTTHNRQAKLRLQGWHHDHDNDHNHEKKTDNNPSEIHFHDFQLPSDYDHDHAPKFKCCNKSLVEPTHIQALFDTSTHHLREPTHQLLKQLSVEFDKVIVIHDMLMSSVVQDIKLIPNAEAFTFIPFPAITMFLDTWRFIPENHRPFQLQPNDIPQCNSDHYEGCMTPEMFKFVNEQVKLLGFESGWLYNTSRVIEGRYLNLMENLHKRIKHFAIGPLHPTAGGFKSKHECIQWLDKQEKGSVIYVSFGSVTSFTEDQIQELAKGLDECGQKFIWVLRNPDSNDVFADDNEGGRMKEPQLPQGYEEKVKGKGIVIKDWAPQLEILAHTSVGGFMSHCGWNSCIESLSMGVPIATWPMHSDQPRNAVLVTQVLKVGVVVRDWAHRNEIVTSSSIENAVEKLMGSEEGKQMKERAVKLGEAIRGSVADGGATCSERDAFISHVTTN